MKIETLSIRNFRSLKAVALSGCSTVNIIIGKNSSGKSNIFAALDIALDHLNSGQITSNWPKRGRPIDELYGRKANEIIQIGIQFSITKELNERLLERISQEVEGIDIAIEQAKGETRLSVIVAGALIEGSIARYVQEITLGSLDDAGDRLKTSGIKIFSVPDTVAAGLVASERALSKLHIEMKSVGRVVEELSPRITWGEKSERDRPRDEERFLLRRFTEDVGRETSRKLQAALRTSTTAEEFSTRIAEIQASLQSQIDEIQSRTASEPMQAFSGSVRRPPEYVIPVIQELGKVKLLHFKETRQPVGLEEAAQLLRLKTTRGGPAQLSAFQSTVKSLLGVSVDAFEPDEEQTTGTIPGYRAPARAAELDIDDFLIEANGAGIREALRILLDLELKKPDFALIEEPEVHLHPGLEKMLHSYLVKKGDEVQIFLATHSTNFLDVTSKQNIYIISRDAKKGSSVERAVSEDDVLRIPGEIGLRPSTIFMFDRLVFVEGPTDETVLGEFARKLNLDLSSKNVGFVRMGGASNTSYFASDATLDLLSKRQVPMTFVLDRDERDQSELDKIAARLGGRAKFHSLASRELENYLLIPHAVRRLIAEKWPTSANRGADLPSVDDISAALKEAALSLKDKVVELKVSRTLLRPVYLDRMGGNNAQAKMQAAMEDLQLRLEQLQQSAEAISEEVSKTWDQVALQRAPGSQVLDLAMRKFGLSYQKERDALRLASLVEPEDIQQELRSLLHQVVS